MSPDDLPKIIATIGKPLTDPEFYPGVFAALAYRPRPPKDLPQQVRQLLLDDFWELSEQLDRSGIQESCTVRNVLKTRQLASLLINDAGDLDQDLLEIAEETMKQKRYNSGPKRRYDVVRQQHLLKVLGLLRQDKQLRQLLKLISKPQNHKGAEQVIRDTLQLPRETSLTDAHSRRAALAAWLCFLRQNVGSCFATAPAIIIHDEQPHLFLKDISELLGTGRLKRTYGGDEYTAPLSSSWGAGDLRKRFALYPLIPKTPAPAIASSPGMIAALRAVDAKAADAEIQQWILQAIQELVGDHPYIVCSAEDILRRVLLDRHQLSLQDIYDYEHRPKPMMQSGIMAHMPAMLQQNTGKSARSAQYLTDFELACSGFKSLTDNALLRTWEFTVASFSEIKFDFAKWNLYSSLGLRADEPGGIGGELYQIVDRKLQMANQKVQDLQDEYEQIFGQVKFLEGRMKSASTEEELRYLRADYQIRRNEFYTFEEMREKAVAKAKRYANLYNALIDIYLRLFPDYFQEVYDADLHDVDVGPYDDSPAGFRLLFKHGRTNTSLWTLIKNHTQFLDALASFFTLSESQIAAMPEVEGLDQDLGEIITGIVTHVKSDNFLLGALYRMAVAHKIPFVEDPLNNIDKLEKKPWAYTSGGTMDTLVACYYKREEKPTETGRWVENEAELLVFLLDCVKKMPHKLAEEYLNDPNRSLLIHSPTHAFLLKPGLSPFREGVRDNTYTYIWVRDHIVQPQQRFVDSLFLDREMIQHLLQLGTEQIPDQFQKAFREIFPSVPGKMKATEFRAYVLNEMARHRSRWQGAPILGAEQIDSLLYRSLPMTHGHQISQRITRLLEALPGMTPQRMQRLGQLMTQTLPTSATGAPITAKRLQDMVKALLSLERRSCDSRQDEHLLVAMAAQKLGFAMPTPILFADTNWVTDFFGFVVNPGTGHFELWRLDYTGSIGSPMASWKAWVNGSRRDRTWGVYVKPVEYRL